ncbi:unnamed protein product [Sphagnum jensenii]|uniref:Uncharacterized protein n=1 Tax=Sphagnum jensenii TaxID=128206 RepID=A0ABP0VKY7_9BRYO
MSLSSDEEVLTPPRTQEDNDLTLARRFDVWIARDGPQRGAVVLRLLGFGVVSLVGVNPDQARIGDIAVEVAHNGFYTSARVWLRVADGTGGWIWISELQESFHFTTYLA